MEWNGMEWNGMEWAYDIDMMVSKQTRVGREALKR
jgi:hypothetical protein